MMVEEADLHSDQLGCRRDTTESGHYAAGCSRGDKGAVGALTYTGAAEIIGVWIVDFINRLSGLAILRDCDQAIDLITIELTACILIPEIAKSRSAAGKVSKTRMQDVEAVVDESDRDPAPVKAGLQRWHS